MPGKAAEDLEHIASVLDQLTSKWTLPVLNELCHGPARFNALKRANPSVTQKALTQCLRRLQANGLIVRTVQNITPLAVVYEVSPLGASLEPITKAILQWSKDHCGEVAEAKKASTEQSIGGK
ncbi:transcriptional regulator [Paracoccus liaowanqingii]|uniref:Transcriptional regulator n=1 Tax=Paracoccus liaowanqingii TaxID=2560053 RepID=A0A4Z1BYJ3_9RHOB|nr:helix-turn-helix domain-containing protein [Paracoccus liaowanqingii]TGN44699.1 transcriptional regulator [Paracoccus liaowanqingii]